MEHEQRVCVRERTFSCMSFMSSSNMNNVGSNVLSAACAAWMMPTTTLMYGRNRRWQSAGSASRTPLNESLRLAAVCAAALATTVVGLAGEATTLLCEGMCVCVCVCSCVCVCG
jgi:hypothetical protein